MGIWERTKGARAAAGRAGAAAGIVGALGGMTGDPTALNSGPGLTKTYGKYAKEVRGPETRRATERMLDRETRAKADRNKHGTELLTKKDRKKLN